jgi:Chaperone of endosialidase
MKKMLLISNVSLLILFLLLVSQTSFAQEISESALKKQVTELKGANELLQKLTPVTFTYNNLDYPYLDNSKSLQYGFNADQVQLVFPSIVYAKNGKYVGGKNLYKSYSLKMVDESGLVPILVASVKELQEQINQLKAEIVQLKQAK